MKQLLFVLITLVFLPTAMAEPSLLLVKITDSKSTEYSTCAEDDCVPHSFWIVHDAIVKKTIAGSYSTKTVRFVRLQHGRYVDRIREHLFVLVDESQDDNFQELFGTRLIARDTAHPVSVVCFDADLREEFPEVERFEYAQGGPRSESCYDQGLLENDPEEE